MSIPIRVIADERERVSGVPGILKTLGARVEYRMLTIGDYIISPECAIERKESHDFINSLFLGRLFDQAHRLSEAYKTPVLIVEGDIKTMIEESTRPRTLWGALATLSFGYGLHVFFTTSVQQTADFIYTIAKRGRFVRPRGPVVHKRPRGETPEEAQLLIVSSLPGVGAKLAGRMLAHFGSVRRVFSATVAELSLVDGIGRVKAEKMAALLDSSYKPARKPLTQARLDEGS